MLIAGKHVLAQREADGQDVLEPCDEFGSTANVTGPLMTAWHVPDDILVDEGLDRLDVARLEGGGGTAVRRAFGC